MKLDILYTDTLGKIFQKNENHDVGIIFVKGIQVLPTTDSNDSVPPEYFEAEILSKKIKRSTGCFDWFLSSDKNQSISKATLKSFNQELDTFINFFIKETKVKKVILITTSFGSIPAFMAIKGNQGNNIEKLVMRGPVFDNAMNHINFRLKKEDSFLNILIKNESDKEKARKTIVKSYEESSNKDFYKLNANKKMLILFGSEETYATQNNIISWGKILGADVKMIKNADHLLKSTNPKISDVKLGNKIMKRYIKWMSL